MESIDMHEGSRLDAAELADCALLLGKLSKAFSNLSGDAKGAMQAAAACALAQSYATEVAAHLCSGVELRESLVQAAEGNLALD